MSHIITCAGNGGMVLPDDEKLRDRGLMLRRSGQRSERHLFGSQGARTGRVFREDLDGIPYDNDFIFDVQPWNFEPSEHRGRRGAPRRLALLGTRTRLDSTSAPPGAGV